MLLYLRSMPLSTLAEGAGPVGVKSWGTSRSTSTIAICAKPATGITLTVVTATDVRPSMWGPREEKNGQSREVLAVRNLRENGGEKTPTHTRGASPRRRRVEAPAWTPANSREEGRGEKRSNQGQETGNLFEESFKTCFMFNSSLL